MSLTKASFSMVNGAPANVLDYGADNTGTTECSAQIQAAIDANSSVYFPAGTYLIGTALSIGSATLGNKMLLGAGLKKTYLKATAAINMLDAPFTNFFNVIKDMTIDGDLKAVTGIRMGDGTNTSAYLTIDSVQVSNCVGQQCRLRKVQYFDLFNCIFAGDNTNNTTLGTVTGLRLDNCANSNIRECLIFNNYIGLQSFSNTTTIYIDKCKWYGPAPATSGQHYITLDQSQHFFFTGCTFENENAMGGPLVSIAAGASASVDINFTDCYWYGLAYANHLVSIGPGVARVNFTHCRAIKPSAGYYIVVNDSGYVVQFIDCIQQNGYNDVASAVRWINGGFVTTPSGETFDIANYSSGTFNPSFLFGGASVGMSVTPIEARWIKTGSLVTCFVDMTLATKGSSTGIATIGPLPFANVQEGTASIGYALNITGVATGNVASNVVNLRDSSFVQLTDAAFVNGSRIVASFSYFAAQ
jgi:hypothetical protein